MAPKILTVNREFESAGNEIAQAVAERLGITYYDRFLITNVAENQGLGFESVEKNDEKPLSRFHLSESQAHIHYTSPSSPPQTSAQVAHAQFDLIRKIAEEESCVIVGRCAGFILREAKKDVVTVFVHAGVESRIQRAMTSLNITREAAERVLKRTDKARKAYHKHYTGLEWNDPDQYDMILNSDTVSFEKCVQLICDLYNV